MKTLIPSIKKYNQNERNEIYDAARAFKEATYDKVEHDVKNHEIINKLLSFSDLENTITIIEKCIKHMSNQNNDSTSNENLFGEKIVEDDVKNTKKAKRIKYKKEILSNKKLYYKPINKEDLNNIKYSLYDVKTGEIYKQYSNIVGFLTNEETKHDVVTRLLNNGDNFKNKYIILFGVVSNTIDNLETTDIPYIERTHEFNPFNKHVYEVIKRNKITNADGSEGYTDEFIGYFSTKQDVALEIDDIVDNIDFYLYSRKSYTDTPKGRFTINKRYFNFYKNELYVNENTREKLKKEIEK